jgi:hypothetical protein
MLWPASNKAFVPDSEQRIWIYVWRYVALALRTGAGYILDIRFSNPASRSAPMPAAFCILNIGSRMAKKAARRDETIPPADEAILSRREAGLKRTAGISSPDPTTRFDHVGLHHQPDLSAGLQELPCRGAKAAGVQSSLGLTELEHCRHSHFEKSGFNNVHAQA